MDVQLTSVFQNLPAGIYAGHIEENDICDCVPAMMNDSVCRMTGFSRKEISERFQNRYGNLVHQDDREKYQDAMCELNEYPHGISLTYRLSKKAGGFIRVTDHMQSVRHENGAMWVYACFTQEESVKEAGEYLTQGRVYVQTFGRFHVTIDGKPIVFHSEKAKELFALLVDRKGYYVSNREIITNLWEEELVDGLTQSRCRKVVFNLKKTLELYGLEDLIESNVKGYRRLNTDMITCDLYQYLSGDERYQNLFKGSYLDEYSWAESTLSNLLFAQ